MIKKAIKQWGDIVDMEMMNDGANMMLIFEKGDEITTPNFTGFKSIATSTHRGIIWEMPKITSKDVRDNNKGMFMVNLTSVIHREWYDVLNVLAMLNNGKADDDLIKFLWEVKRSNAKYLKGLRK